MGIVFCQSDACILDEYDQMLKFIIPAGVEWDSGNWREYEDQELNDKQKLRNLIRILNKGGILRRFDQSDFLDTFLWESTSLSQFGYVFYPEQCVSGEIQCKLHIHLHGCAAGIRDHASFEEALVLGMNYFAVKNNLIVVYPDVDRSFANKYGCFDSYGYTGEDYLTNEAV